MFKDDILRQNNNDEKLTTNYQCYFFNLLHRFEMVINISSAN